MWTICSKARNKGDRTCSAATPPKSLCSARAVMQYTMSAALSGFLKPQYLWYEPGVKRRMHMTRKIKMAKRALGTQPFYCNEEVVLMLLISQPLLLLFHSGIGWSSRLTFRS